MSDRRAAYEECHCMRKVGKQPTFRLQEALHTARQLGRIPQQCLQCVHKEFDNWCIDNQIRFNAAAPARQHQNGICERHWASCSNMARKMLIRAHLNKKFLYYAIKYAAILHNVLPVKSITREDGEIATPFELFH